VYELKECQINLVLQKPSSRKEIVHAKIMGANSIGANVQLFIPKKFDDGSAVTNVTDGEVGAITNIPSCIFSDRKPCFAY